MDVNNSDTKIVVHHHENLSGLQITRHNSIRRLFDNVHLLRGPKMFSFKGVIKLEQSPLSSVVPDVFEDFDPCEEDNESDHVVVLHLPESQEFEVGVHRGIFQQGIEQVIDGDGSIHVERE